MTHSDIINNWNTRADLARDMGVKQVTVRKWKERESIPPQYWRTLIKAGKKIKVKITLDMLVDSL